jgi:hypothetical protein
MSRLLENVLLLDQFQDKAIVYEGNPAVIKSWIGVQRALIDENNSFALIDENNSLSNSLSIIDLVFVFSVFSFLSFPIA